jgi:hypothetical protein
MENVDHGHFEVIDVPEDNNSLRKFIEKLKGPKSYDRGCSYYEHTDIEVDIGKEMLIMDEVSKLAIH